MSYFDEVYLKRINIDGNTRQDRIKTRKEKEFDKIFLKQTEYKSLLYKINDDNSNIICSLQPNKWNESSLISNLLMSTSAAPLKTGDILHIEQQIKDKKQDKIWLVLFVEDNLTKGYQLFKIICLDSFINITDEYGNTKYKIPVKFVNSTSSLVQDTFSYSNSNSGYREPNRNRSFITKDFDFLNKDVYFEYADKGWEIAGKDNISINNVSYTTISERLVRKEELKSSEDLLVGENDNFFLNGR